MKLKLVVVSAIILLLTFILVVNLRPQDSLSHLQGNLENRLQILISEPCIGYDSVLIPKDFDNRWLSLESTLNQNNYSLTKYQGKKLTRYTYYVLDSPYHRSMVNPNVNIHLNVYTKNEKIVGAYLFKEDEPEITYPLDYTE